MTMSTGLCFAFGVFQDLYQSMASEPDTPFTGASPAGIDLIGTLSVAFMTIFAPFVTALTKRFAPRHVIGSGGVLLFVAAVLASVSQRLWQFQLTQGFLLGLATCCSFIPAVTVSPTHFGARRALALGLITSGTGIGGVIWGPALEALNARVGFRDGLRIAGAVSGASIVLAGLALDWDDASKARFRQEEAATGKPVSLVKVPFVQWRIAKTRRFQAQAIAATLQGAAYYTPVSPFSIPRPHQHPRHTRNLLNPSSSSCLVTTTQIFFFSAYARTLGYSSASGANFIALSNACNALGKIVIGLLADKYGRLNALLATTAVSATASICLWLPSSLLASRPLFLAYTVCYGVFASAYVSLFPSVVLEAFGPAQFPAVYGSMYQMRGLATFVGTPVAGALIRGASGGGGGARAYWGTVVMVAGLLSAATASLAWARVESGRGPIKGWRK